jgi:hypothetical protein
VSTLGAKLATEILKLFAFTLTMVGVIILGTIITGGAQATANTSMITLELCTDGTSGIVTGNSS